MIHDLDCLLIHNPRPEPGFKQLFAPTRLDGELRFKQEYGNAFSSNTFYLVGDIVDQQEMYGSVLNGN